MGDLVKQITKGANGPSVIDLSAVRVRQFVRAAVLPGPATWDVATVRAKSLLDGVYDQLLEESADTSDAMTELMSGLYSLRRAAAPGVWEAIVRQSRAHPLCRLIHQDPFTARSFLKPRGYAGDAVLIDYIYTGALGLEGAPDVSPVGERVFAFNRETPACRAVRVRRDLVASMIDEVCARCERPRVLSVACGHLREAAIAHSVSAGRVGRFVGLDQDALSIEVVQREASLLGVVAVCNSIKAMFRGPLAEETFDFIYSTGLYDYLDDRLAAKLTQRMFEMLNPGGRLLVANFLPDTWGAGYMEAFMDWNLIYRDVTQMRTLSMSVSQTSAQRLFVEENENIVFLELHKS